MSVRARIEAVVYAAEEPVTLLQLASIFGAEIEAELALTRTSEHDEAAPAGESAASGPPQTTAEPPTDVRDEVATAETSSLAADPSIAEQLPEPSEDAAKRLARHTERAIRDRLRIILNELIAEFAGSDRGMEIREVAGGYRMSTKPEYHDAVRAFVKALKPPMKLSLQALETLAVVAYKQPVTGPEISEIRGVEAGGVLGNLIGRKLITTAGRKQVIGRPILYKTTKEFLLRFGLKDLNELPSIEEFEKMAGELADAENEPLSNVDAIPSGQMPSAAELVSESASEASPEPSQADSSPNPHAELHPAPEERETS